MKKTNLEALNNENCEELSRRNLAQNSNVPRSQEDLITQVFEKRRVESQRSWPRSLVGQKTAFQARYPVLTAFS